MLTSENLDPNATQHVCEIEVRGYELDSFGHVNHAQYVHYLEHARWKFLESRGITLPHLKQWGCWPVISKIQLKYLKPTFIGDLLRIESTSQKVGKTQFKVHQKISKSTPSSLRTKNADSPAESEPASLVLLGEIDVVMVNSQGRPIEIPSSFESALFPGGFSGTEA